MKISSDCKDLIKYVGIYLVLVTSVSYVGANYASNIENVLMDCETKVLQERKQSEANIKFEKSINKSSKFNWINEFVVEVDLEPDGVVDGYIKYIGARPGDIIYTSIKK